MCLSAAEEHYTLRNNTPQHAAVAAMVCSNGLVCDQPMLTYNSCNIESTLTRAGDIDAA
jgi:hypothetical protein